MASVRPYLETVGKFKVEQIPCPHFPQPIVLTAPRTGVVHTIEGRFEDGLAVFKTHFAPQFIIGDGRIAQLVQVGTIGAALVTHNDHAIVQVEVAGRSQQSKWMFDEATEEVLVALMATCKVEYGIPLTHPWPDGDYGVYGPNPHRSSGKWGVEPGWFGHGDVPSPDVHWDPGALEWSAILARAASMTDILGAPAWTPPPVPPHPCAHPSDPAPAVDLLSAAKAMEAAVKAFQKAAALDQDGLPGQLTNAAYQHALAA